MYPEYQHKENLPLQYVSKYICDKADTYENRMNNKEK